ncbi:hypothetical protein BGY98DRAFT_958776 [Russula aff. rugulosa BPL654]|nr:hypothetical protein BGY98DRAFT_958776 [Russula aff. rugulosa BPL654]
MVTSKRWGLPFGPPPACPRECSSSSMFRRVCPDSTPPSQVCPASTPPSQARSSRACYCSCSPSSSSVTLPRLHESHPSDRTNCTLLRAQPGAGIQGRRGQACGTMCRTRATQGERGHVAHVVDAMFSSVKHLCALLLEQFHRSDVLFLPGLMARTHTTSYAETVILYVSIIIYT